LKPGGRLALHRLREFLDDSAACAVTEESWRLLELFMRIRVRECVEQLILLLTE
jgi:hypothetical protein